MENCDLLMRLSVRGLGAIGMRPLDFKNPLKNIAYKFYHYFVLVYFTVFVITEYIDLFASLDNASLEIVNTLCVCLLYTTTIVKLLTVLSDNMLNLLDQIRSSEKVVMEGDDETLKQIHWKHVKLITWLTYIIYSLAPTTLAPYFITPYVEYVSWQKSDLNETFQKVLPFNAWIPFDRQKNYPVAFFLHVIAGCFGASITVITDAYLWGNIVFAIGQMKMLQYKLRSFREHAIIMGKANGLNEEDAVRMTVLKCLILHKRIINFVNKLDYSMNMLMLMDFAICSMQMGACGMRIFIPGTPGFSIVSAIEFLIAMLIQMIIFYWHANEITLESCRISQAIYESNWYECTDEIKQSLKFMMLRGQKPMNLNIGPFYAMSTTTAISIMKAAYSYITLMRQTYK